MRLVAVLAAVPLQPCSPLVIDVSDQAGPLGSCGPMTFVDGADAARVVGTCAKGDAALVDRDGFPTIQDAVDAAPDGATVLVCPGDRAEHVRVAGRDLQIAGASGDPADTVLRGTGGTILTVRDSTLHLTDLTLADGAGGDRGGAVDATGGSLRLTGVVAEANRAKGGGAVWFDGEVLEVVDSAFTGNVASSDDGGAIAVAEGCLTISRSTFDGNAADYAGGALTFGAWDGGRLEVVDSTFRGNTAGYEGGAIDAGAWSLVEVVVDRCVFEDDFADYSGGALSVGSHEQNVVEVTDSVFRRNEAGYEGGAITVGGWADDELTLARTVLEDNVSGYAGGAINTAGWGHQTTTIIDCTIARNVAEHEGGALAAYGQGETDVRIEGGTVSGNLVTRGQSGAIEHGKALVQGVGVDFGPDANTAFDLSSDCGGRRLGVDASFTCDRGTWSVP